MRGPRGQATLLLVVLAMGILAIAGIALQVATSAERTIAVNEWGSTRALYAADAGVRWAAARLGRPDVFLARPEFRDPPDPFGSVVFPLPAHFHGPDGPFTGDPAEEGVRVVVFAPSLLGRRRDPAGTGFHYLFEVRVRACENAPVPRFASELAADVEVGPLPEDLALPAAAAAGETAGWTGAVVTPALARAIIRRAQWTEAAVAESGGGGFRCVTMNWKEP